MSFTRILGLLVFSSGVLGNYASALEFKQMQVGREQIGGTSATQMTVNALPAIAATEVVADAFNLTKPKQWFLCDVKAQEAGSVVVGLRVLMVYDIQNCKVSP
jgi:hypothetical protein